MDRYVRVAGKRTGFTFLIDKLHHYVYHKHTVRETDRFSAETATENRLTHVG